MSCGDSGPVLPRVAVVAGPLVAFAVEAAVAGSSVWCRGYDVVTAAGQPVSASRGGAQQSPSPRLAWASISAAGMPSLVLLFPGAPGWWGAESSAQKSGLHDASGRGGSTVKSLQGLARGAQTRHPPIFRLSSVPPAGEGRRWKHSSDSESV